MQMTTDFKITFDGDSHEIDLNTLLTSLLGFSGAIQEIQKVIAPESKMEIKVRAPERGSFLIDLMLQAPDTIVQTVSMFPFESVNLVENVISIFSNLINLKQHFGGDLPKEVSHNADGLTVSVKNTYGDVYVVDQRVYNIYKGHPKIEGLISKGFEAIEKDDAIDGLKISDQHGTVLAEVNESVFEIMAKPGLDMTPAEKRTVEKKNVPLRAFRFSLADRAYKWGFVYEGDPINALISDEAFWKLIDDNEPFAKGDILRVNLLVYQEYDKTMQDYLNKSYEVVLVLEHIHAERQSKLF